MHEMHDHKLINIEIGEIKVSVKELSTRKAYRQLLLRLAVLHYASSIFFPDKGIEFKLTGRLFVPAGEVGEQDLKKEWGKGINIDKHLINITLSHI